MSNLETEMATYKRLLPTLLSEQGKFALIFDGNLIGTFTSYEDALKVGYERCGIKPFLVKRISVEEQISYFTRDIGRPCQA